MKSTATVTWINYRNFGTCLQAYALQKTIQGLGYSNKIVDDASVIRSFSKKRFSPLRMLRNVSWLYPERAYFKDRFSASAEKFDNFKNEHLDIDSDWKSREDLAGKYDIYIAGSDQIWSPNVPFDDFYYLGFTEKPKVAYAPSFGTVTYPSAKIPYVSPLLASFSALSVREPQGKSILKDKFSLDAEVVADPTMLLTRDDWDRLAQNAPGDDRPYVLCYLLTYNETYLDFVRTYCKERGLELKIPVVSHELAGIPGTEEVYTGPEGFLSLIKGAEAVMTDSFHGTIFSLIFQKDFHTFRRFREGSTYSQNSRIEHLLGIAGLDDRLLSEDSLVISETPIDYARVGTYISALREDSINYLKRSLQNNSDDLKTAYAAYACDTHERYASASGGAASMLAKSFIRNGGVVYGCGQGSGAVIKHMRIDKEEEVVILAGSKYVLSQTSHLTNLIKEDLSQGRKVLFIGIPCQVAGIKSSFRNDFESARLLYTADLCCHGTPSQDLLRQHIGYLGLTSSADKVVFRKKGPSGVRYVFEVLDKNGREIYGKKAGRDWYMTGFLSGLFLRKCCFTCPYARPERISDITYADYWSIGKSEDPEMNVSKGLSTILVNTIKGKDLFEMSSPYLTYEQRPLREALRNGQFISASVKPKDYDDFVRSLEENGYESTCRRYLPTYMRSLFVNELKSRYYKSPLRQSIRKFLGK